MKGRWQAKFDELKEELDVLKNENNSLKKEKVEIALEKDEVMKKYNELTKLFEIIENLKQQESAQVEILEKEIDNWINKHDEKIRIVDALSKEIEELKESNKSHIDRLKIEKEARQCDIDKLRELREFDFNDNNIKQKRNVDLFKRDLIKYLDIYRNDLLKYASKIITYDFENSRGF